jgi:hypothetical protein
MDHVTCEPRLGRAARLKIIAAGFREKELIAAGFSKKGLIAAGWGRR